MLVVAVLLGGGCQHLRQRCGLRGFDRRVPLRVPNTSVVNAGYCETRWISFTATRAAGSCVHSNAAMDMNDEADQVQGGLSVPQPLSAAELLSPEDQMTPTLAPEVTESVEMLDASESLMVTEEPESVLE